ncbi:MAG: hypothetical protein QJR03_11785, partial [Sphaerobacter sp.]|nr:hypothetical protein [Sphaerobacter sp.]
MTRTLGSEAFRYEALAEWEQLPATMRLIECPGVAVDADDRVYVLTRNPANPVLVFDAAGTLLRTFG